MTAALADLSAAIADRGGDAVHRPATDFARQLGAGEGRVPGGGEAGGVGPGAQAISGLPTHPHRAGRGRDVARVLQREDEHDLADGRPAVMARADGDGGEIGAHG